MIRLMRRLIKKLVGKPIKIVLHRLTRFYFRPYWLMPKIFPVIAFLGSYLGILFLTWITIVLRDLFGVPYWIALTIVIIPIFAVFYILSLSMILFGEKMWKFFGIYWLLNISDKPIERVFASFAEAEDLD